METPAPGQHMDSTVEPTNDRNRNYMPQQQQQQHHHHHEAEPVRVEPLERQFGGGIPAIDNYRIPVVGQKRDANGFVAPCNGLPIPNPTNPTPSQDGKGFVKLFVGFVPKTITEDEIRPVFAQHGNVLEVALVKDKITGQQRGCCFIKYATVEEADRAIKAMDDNYTLPGGAGPVRVKYADGELERLGAVECKLFVSNVNTQATEKEIEEIFARYGRVEYVYIMKDEQKHSKGSAFVKYASREMAAGAIDALNGTFVMEGCQHPLIVRYAASKKRRVGSDAPYPTFGRQGFGYGPMGARNIAGPGRGTRGQFPPTYAHPLGGQIRGSSLRVNSFPHGNPITSGWNPIQGIPPMVGAMTGPRGQVDASVWRSVQAAPQRTGPGSSISPSLGQAFNSAPMQQQTQPYGQQLPQIQQKLHEQVQQQMQPLPYPEMHHNSYQRIQHGQPTQSGPFLSSNEQLPFFQPQRSEPPLPQTINDSQQLQLPATHQIQLQPQAPAEHSVNQPIQPAIPNHFQSQQFCPPLQQQQQQPLFQKQQQCSMQLQYPLQQQHPTHTMTHPQQNQIVPTPCHDKQSQAHLDQPKPVRMAPAIPSTNTTQPIAAATVFVGGGSAPTLTCNWTQHTSLEGMRYYYNTLTGESQWEKPAELTSFEQQQKQPPSEVLQPQVQMQQTYSHPLFQFQPQQLLQPAIATLGQKPAELTMFEQQKKQTPPQVLQPQSQIQLTHSHPQFQPQQQQQSQILQPSMPKAAELTMFEQQQKQTPQQVLQSQSQIQQTHSHPQFQPLQQQQSQILQPSMPKAAELTMFEQQQKQTPPQVLQSRSQIQQTHSHPQFQPQQQQQSQILQPSMPKAAELTMFEQQQKQKPPQVLQSQSQIQQTHSHPQFQPQQQQQSQILQPSMPKPNTVPAIAPAKVAEPMTVTVTTVADSRAPFHPALTCDWKEHTSPDGVKYYHNEVTGLSQWEKPTELTAFENQQAMRPQP